MDQLAASFATHRAIVGASRRKAGANAMRIQILGTILLAFSLPLAAQDDASAEQELDAATRR